MRRRTPAWLVAASLLALGPLGLCIWRAHDGSTAGAPTAAATTTPSNEPSSFDDTSAPAHSQEVMAVASAAVYPGAAPGSVLDSKAEITAAAVESIRTAVQSMLEVQGRFDQERRRAEVARSLASNEDTRRATAALLTDSAVAKRLFGEKSAEARYFAAYTVREAVRLGERDWALDLVESLSHGVPDAVMKANAGRIADFSDVVSAVVEAMGPEDFRAHREELLRRFGYGDGPPAARRTVRLAVRDGIWRRDGFEAAEDFVQTTL